jgi:hypothetical protein
VSGVDEAWTGRLIRALIEGRRSASDMAYRHWRYGEEWTIADRRLRSSQDEVVGISAWSLYKLLAFTFFRSGQSRSTLRSMQPSFPAIRLGLAVAPGLVGYVRWAAEQIEVQDRKVNVPVGSSASLASPRYVSCILCLVGLLLCKNWCTEKLLTILCKTAQHCNQDWSSSGIYLQAAFGEKSTALWGTLQCSLQDSLGIR